MADLGRRASITRRWPDHVDGPWLVTVHFAPVHGVAQCVGIDVRAFRDDGSAVAEDLGPLTASVIRSLPVGQIIERGLRDAEVIHGDEAFLREALEGREETIKAVRRDAKAYRRRTGRQRYEWDRQRLEEAAAVYANEAAMPGRSAPTEAVAKAFTISHSMATKVVAMCRDEGLLPATTQGKAAGRPRDDEGTPE